ncbi:SSU ribosomal protein S1p [Clostridiaceae bacterium JG1575]|nr:SSU ribosomal protein S1p [Clostridiaceae bacterium JG1575]
MMDEKRIGEDTLQQEDVAAQTTVEEGMTSNEPQGQEEKAPQEEAAAAPEVKEQDTPMDEVKDPNHNAEVQLTSFDHVPEVDAALPETVQEDAHEEEEKSDDDMSMAELMEKYDNPVRMGQIIKGKVIQLDDKEAIIALIGAGNDGKLNIDEVSFDDSDKLTEMMKIGDEVEAKVIRRPIENDSFYILSMKEVQREASKDELLAVLNKDETITARVKEAVKGGLVAFFKGHRIFIPASQVDINSVRDLTQYEGKEIEINIIEAEERRGSTRIVASRKKHLLKKKQEIEAKAWEELEEGAVETGRVERLTDFGAFINVRGVDGLLHISEITHGKIPKPSNVLKVGEEVAVKIIRLDKENQRLSLSMKALQEDPWKNIADKYPNGAIVLGKVVRFTEFGAFIELEPGVDGLAHISQLSHARVEKPGEVLTLGETIKVKILDTNERDKKVSLSVKAVE